MVNLVKAFLFEIASNQAFPNEFLYRSIGTPEVLFEVALPEIVLQFRHVDLLEDQIQW